MFAADLFRALKQQLLPTTSRPKPPKTANAIHACCDPRRRFEFSDR